MAPKKQNWAKSLTMALNLGTSVAAVIAIGLFGGKWLDARFETGMVFTILGFLLGAATAMKMLWDRMMERDREATAEKQDAEPK
ncbi:MAG: AtpZ/AtpI family protein [Syntrophomonas sp.]|nr:AtpZ/AtpI family protein [Syntrophomonas sp.]